MIHTLFRNSARFGLFSASIVGFLALACVLMVSVLVFLSFPQVGDLLAQWVGQERFGRLVHMLL